MDIKHCYVEKGEGDALIMLHGNGGKNRYFKHQIDVFAQRYHVYAIDTRGQGNTPRGVKPFTISQFADDLLGFMNENNIEKATLLGFSDGGNIAMVFAINYPERVDKLILNGANFTQKGSSILNRYLSRLNMRLQNCCRQSVPNKRRKLSCWVLWLTTPIFRCRI